MVAVGLALLACAGGAQAQTVRRLLPPTSQSPMWLDPALSGTSDASKIAKAGYVREEWFQTGRANVYGYDTEGRVTIERRNIPYTTRLIVVRPRDKRRFSGTVQLNPLHPAMGMGNWATMADYALAKGDAYVGVMIGADDNTRRAPPGPVPVMATRTLAWFNAKRYAAIDWPADEDGIRWDVFAGTARLVRAADGPLAGLTVRRTYASGWSFTGSFLRTFINSGFHDRARLAGGRPLIDGYLIGISSFSFRSGYMPINTRTPNLPVDDPRRANLPIDVPVIELQSENEAITNREPQSPDRDTAPGAHRLYEVPGLTHGSGDHGDNIAARQIATRTGQSPPPTATTCAYPATDIDMAAFAMAAHDNLDRWVRAGTPPPRAERLEHDGSVQRRDANGNTLGGIRPAQISVPLAQYGAAPAGSGCDVSHNGLGSPALPMRRVPLTIDRLHMLYPGGAPDYSRKFDAAVDALVAQRWLLASDAAAQKRAARRNAAAAFR